MARGPIAGKALREFLTSQAAKAKVGGAAGTTAAGVASPATTAAIGAGGKEGIAKLLAYAGKHKITAGLGAFFLIQMILNAIKGHAGTFMQQDLERQQIEGQMAISPEDVYYQAMLPQLSEQRKTAQNALLQAILTGGGEMPTVPGERVIGG